MYYLFVKDAQLAQLVEQRTENPRVSGSIPELGILEKFEYGTLAQVVEHLTFNQVVRGSSPRCLICLIYGKPFNKASHNYFIFLFFEYYSGRDREI